MKILIIDADSIIYKIAFTNLDTPWEVCKKAAQNYLQEIFEKTQGTHFVLCLTVGKCFRYNVGVTKPYKGNRKYADRPVHLDRLKEYFITDYKAFYAADKYEADDLIFILKSQYEVDFPESEIVLCINDKDCLQYEGSYYDYHKKIEIYLNEKDANEYFLTQMLTGDSTDNINILEGVGPKTAQRILALDGDIVTVFTQFFAAFGQDLGIKKFYEAFMLTRMVSSDSTIIAPELLQTNIKEYE